MQIPIWIFFALYFVIDVITFIKKTMNYETGSTQMSVISGIVATCYSLVLLYSTGFFSVIELPQIILLSVAAAGTFLGILFGAFNSWEITEKNNIHPLVILVVFLLKYCLLIWGGWLNHLPDSPQAESFALWISIATVSCFLIGFLVNALENHSSKFSIFHEHTWSKWETVSETSARIDQKKTCETCGIVKTRSQKLSG